MKKQNRNTQKEYICESYGLQLHFLVAYDAAHVKRYNVADNDNAVFTTHAYTHTQRER